MCIFHSTNTCTYEVYIGGWIFQIFAWGPIWWGKVCLGRGGGGGGAICMNLLVIFSIFWGHLRKSKDSKIDIFEDLKKFGDFKICCGKHIHVNRRSTLTSFYHKSSHLSIMGNTCGEIIVTSILFLVSCFWFQHIIGINLLLVGSNQLFHW